MEGKRILVTGGAGYLGCILCPMLADQGASVCVFDRLYFGKEGLLSAMAPESFELVAGDIREVERFPQLLTDVWAVVHLASLANDPSCDLSPTMAEQINHAATIKLARMAQAKGVERFVFASSCSVYGASGDKQVSEDSPLAPVSLYARLKIKSERALLPMADEVFAPTALRQATLFGFSPRMRFDLAINLMTMSAVVKGEIIVLGGGRQWRPFVHVKDAARAIIAVLKADKEVVAGQVFNVGSNSLNFTIEALASLVASRVPKTRVQVAPDDADKRSYRVRFDRIEQRLGYSARVGPDEGVEEIRAAIVEGHIREPYGSQHFNVMHLKHLMSVPVAHGGETPRTRTLQNFLPPIESCDRDRVCQELQIVARGQWRDPVKELEEMLSETFDRPAALLLHSHYLALLGALSTLGEGPHKEVIIHPFADGRLYGAAVQLGFTPVICDVDEETLCYDFGRLKQLLGDNTVGIVAGSILDIPEPLPTLEATATEAGVSLIVNVQDLLGASVLHNPVASYGTVSVVDFGVDQNVTTLGGGAVLLNDANERQRILDFLSCRLASGPIAVAERQFVLSPMCAMLGVSTLERLSEISQTCRKLQHAYEEVLSDARRIKLPRPTRGARRSGSKFPILVNLDGLPIDIWELERLMRAERIEALRGRDCALDLAVTQMRANQDSIDQDLAPKARAMRSGLLFLPLHSKMTTGDVNDAASALLKILTYFEKRA